MSWKTVTLGEIIELQNGYAFKSSEYAEAGYFLMRITNVQQGFIQNNNPKYVTIPESSKLKQFILNEGDILMSLTGDVGRVGVLNESNLPAALNQRVARVVIKSIRDLNKNYIFNLLNSEIIRNQIESLGHGAAQLNVSTKDILSIKVQLPSIATQQKIVAKLDAIFAEIDTAKAAAEANAKNAEALFQSYVTEVFETEKYNFKLVKFGTTASFVRGPFGGSLKKSIFVEKGYAVYEQQHAIYNQFSEIRYFIDESKFEEMKRFELKSGDLIMSCSGTMGKIAIVPKNIEPGVINQALLKITPNTNVMGEYIARLLSSKYFQDILTKLSGGAAIQNVPAVSVLKDIEVPIPSIKNQKLIVDIIDVLESNKSIIKNSYKSKSKELANLKQSILQQAFSGELVKD